MTIPTTFTSATTARGFARLNFSDFYDVPCSVQESSLATDDAIWLGCNNADPRHLVPGKGWVPVIMPSEYVANIRMHLSRNQVIELIAVLQRWIDTGSLTLDEEIA